jgi:hypothetical protein
MSADADDARRTAAQAAGLERYFRAATTDVLTRILVAFIVVGGLGVGLAAGEHSHNGVAAAALLSFGVALLGAFAVVMRYLGIRRRLGEDPAAEVARLRAKPGRHQRRFFAGADTTRSRTPAGGLSDDPIATVGDPYVQMRNVGLGPDASPDGVNRTGDPGLGPVE